MATSIPNHGESCDNGVVTSPDSLRGEIIESQKQIGDILQWKLVATSIIAAAALGVETGSVKVFSDYVLCVAPFVCAFCDLLCAQVAARIAVIGGYLRSRGDPYEVHVGSRKDLFAIEPAIAVGSTLFISVFVGLYPYLRSRIFVFDSGAGATTIVNLARLPFLAAGALGIIGSFVYLYLRRRIGDESALGPNSGKPC